MSSGEVKRDKRTIWKGQFFN